MRNLVFTASYYYFYFINFFGKVSMNFAAKQIACWDLRYFGKCVPQWNSLRDFLFFRVRSKTMVVILKDGADSKKVKNLTDWLENQNISVHKVIGEYQTILGLIGDTSKIDIDLIQGLDIVEKVKRISEPYKHANRKFHPDDTIIDVGAFAF